MDDKMSHCPTDGKMTHCSRVTLKVTLQIHQGGLKVCEHYIL
jgi:hypothetical protein